MLWKQTIWKSLWLNTTECLFCSGYTVNMRSQQGACSWHSCRDQGFRKLHPRTCFLLWLLYQGRKECFSVLLLAINTFHVKVTITFTHFSLVRVSILVLQSLVTKNHNIVYLPPVWAGSVVAVHPWTMHQLGWLEGWELASCSLQACSLTLPGALLAGSGISLGAVGWNTFVWPFHMVTCFPHGIVPGFQEWWP